MLADEVDAIDTPRVRGVEDLVDIVIAAKGIAAQSDSRSSGSHGFSRRPSPQTATWCFGRWCNQPSAP